MLEELLVVVHTTLTLVQEAPILEAVAVEVVIKALVT
jgi:hypothetical protein